MILTFPLFGMEKDRNTFILTIAVTQTFLFYDENTGVSVISDDQVYAQTSASQQGEEETWKSLVLFHAMTQIFKGLMFYPHTEQANCEFTTYCL